MIRCARVFYNLRVWKATPVTETAKIYPETILRLKPSRGPEIEVFASEVSIDVIHYHKTNNHAKRSCETSR